jgi:hypothetical protein
MLAKLRTKRQRANRYHQLREIRRERDYQIGLLQFANRPISKPSARIDRPKLTTTKFMKRMGLK